MKSRYSEGFKQSTIQKIMLPGGPSIMEMAEKIGIHHTSIRKWKEKYVNVIDMKKIKKFWTPEEKLRVVNETSSMSEHELGEYLRKNGLHSSEIEEWRKECLAAFKTVGRPKKDSEVFELRKDKKKLEKDLHRKDKALAEMSARNILLKKRNLIFGEEEDEE
jgi:transposase-like protein